MARSVGFGVADGIGVALLAVIGGGAAAFRQAAIAPRATVGMCAAADPPGFCWPRAVVLWLQYEQAFGWVALVLGVSAFIAGWRLVAAAAVGVGIVAVINYNASTGIPGTVLGLVAWLGAMKGRYGQVPK